MGYSIYLLTMLSIADPLKVLFLIIIVVVISYHVLRSNVLMKRNEKPVSVNYHFSRQCNKACKFCFHTATTSYVLQLSEARKGLLMLKNAGMRKINFAGGEPFLYKKLLGKMIKYCKEDLELESVSIVTNGSLVTKDFLDKNGHNIDILAVSCDSFVEATNIEIGRGSGNNVQQLYQISRWCRDYGIKFKINTVICTLNWEEDMNYHISKLEPFRWKCFQVLLVDGENESEQRLRDVRSLLISENKFNGFVDRHRSQDSLVPESNQLMAKSYLILDEYMRFLDRDGRKPSPSILEVGVQSALKSVFWDKESFKARGGLYDWGKQKSACSESRPELEW